MTEDALTQKRLLAIWWAYIWRATILGGVAGGILGFVAGVILTMIGLKSMVQPVGALLGLLVGIPISLWAMRTTLTKSYRGFKIRIETEADVF